MQEPSVQRAVHVDVPSQRIQTPSPPSCLQKAYSFLPVSFLLLIIFYLYFVYVFIHVLPMLRGTDPYVNRSHEQWIKAVVYISVFHWLFFWLLVSAFRAILTDPGRIPNDPLWKATAPSTIVQPYVTAPAASPRLTIPRSHDSGGDPYSSFQGTGGTQRNNDPEIISIPDSQYGGDVVCAEKKFFKGASAVRGADQQARRFCRTCCLYKPDRTHHCRVCNRCVSKMDHHCPWIRNCVGFRNHKYFLCLLLYAVLTSAFVLGTMWESLSKIMTQENSTVWKELHIVFAYSLTALLSFFITLFFCFHCMLVWTSFTTIEFYEKHRAKHAAIAAEYKVSKFNVGAFENFLQVMGRNPLLWFFPIESEPEHDGTRFPLAPHVRAALGQKGDLSASEQTGLLSGKRKSRCC
eukprot:GILJ01000277.1.p1 GENE.GILJ01000277.1~~GILJ01000277.1.p1  ORF type:complete len:406 (+),score=35.52 GILJ01000277.1:60-1277(+)